MRRLLAFGLALALSLSLAAPALANGPQYVFPAGVACSGFDLGVDVGPGGPQNEAGNKNFTVVAGRGAPLTFTNMKTKATFSTRATGSVSRTESLAGGAYRQYLTGGWVIILFPTDFPAGPSTTVHLGRVVVHVSAGGVSTVESTSGRAIDVCAALG